MNLGTWVELGVYALLAGVAVRVELEKRKRPNVFRRFATGLGLQARTAGLNDPVLLEGTYRERTVQVDARGGATTITVRARATLPQGMRLQRETATSKHAGAQDIQVGASGLDRSLLIQGDDEEEIAALVVVPEVREALMRFFARNPTGRIEDGKIIARKSTEPHGAEELTAWLDEAVGVADALDQAIAPDPARGRASAAELARVRAGREHAARVLRSARSRRIAVMLSGVALMSAGFFFLGGVHDQTTAMVRIFAGLIAGGAVIGLAYRCPACGSRVRMKSRSRGLRLYRSVCDDCGATLQ